MTSEKSANNKVNELLGAMFEATAAVALLCLIGLGFRAAFVVVTGYSNRYLNYYLVGVDDRLYDRSREHVRPDFLYWYFG